MTLKNAVEIKDLPTLFDAWRPNATLIRLPFPPSELMPNNKNGKHWAATHSVKKKYKEDCFYLTKHSGSEFIVDDEPIRVTLMYMMPDKRHRDVDNLLAASKAGLDGVAEALGVNDNQFQPICVYRFPGEKPGLLIVQLEKL
jgi:Holliday junction resolvase RusA-like endonuclease